MRETTNLSVQIMNSKRQVKGEFGHVAGAPNDRFLENICSEPSRLAKIFESPRTAKIFENVSW